MNLVCRSKLILTLAFLFVAVSISFGVADIQDGKTVRLSEGITHDEWSKDGGIADQIEALEYVSSVNSADVEDNTVDNFYVTFTVDKWEEVKKALEGLGLQIDSVV